MLFNKERARSKSKNPFMKIPDTKLSEDFGCYYVLKKKVHLNYI